ncbi:MAG TPA: tRNA lysidine(34) synthetase TilS [Terracidiphilus sp.]|nr:tRNA lysidine(34) synthetase TilS [Terracidiphilus sp.]
MATSLTLDASLLTPGLRLAVGLSGGADSVALLRALAQQARELGLVLHAAHLHHGLRGAEADADLAFAQSLAEQLDIPFHHARVDTAAEAKARPGKPAESIEEAARRLRYSWFRQLLSEVPLDAMATAHTLDDQAETVLAKLLRGAWTEGLSAIHPVVTLGEGRIIRPLLAVSRAEIEQYLRALNQPWREDASNRDTAFTRNRIRHQLLPMLETENPRLRQHFAQMATLARDEEAWWQTELARIAPQLLLPGTPVRSGGRAAGDTLALDVTRFAALAPALQRRLLRHAAAQFGAAPDFAATESLRALALTGRASQKLDLAQSLRAERTHRELRLTSAPADAEPAPEYIVPIPGTAQAPAFGLTLTVESDNPQGKQATLRAWQPGDRVRIRHSAGPRKVKEVLERMKVTGSDRALWPVLELDGHIVWMRGVELDPPNGQQADLRIAAVPLV